MTRRALAATLAATSTGLRAVADLLSVAVRRLAR